MADMGKGIVIKSLVKTRYSLGLNNKITKINIFQGYFRYAEALMALRQFDEAIAYYKRALEKVKRKKNNQSINQGCIIIVSFATLMKESC